MAEKREEGMIMWSDPFVKGLLILASISVISSVITYIAIILYKKRKKA